ncbi:hypothetical protein EVA_04848 [gut metagenome]|uniref:Uncharacterized protein n=1 Tax=gut metagenome TaxID=749906 RepID=J9GIR5_9ZZZZ
MYQVQNDNQSYNYQNKTCSKCSNGMSTGCPLRTLENGSAALFQVQVSKGLVAAKIQHHVKTTTVKTNKQTTDYFLNDLAKCKCNNGKIVTL